jgi:septal ring factor EnvC (AmiA/AmiB activator)
VKTSEILEEDVLKKGMEKINRDKEMKDLKKEIKEKDEENRKMKEDLRKKDEEIKKMKEDLKKKDEDLKKKDEEIKILQQQLRETKTANNDEKGNNKLFTLYFIFFSSFWFRSC